MSALGQKQTSKRVQSMSALPPKADVKPVRVTFGAKAPAAWRYSLRSACLVLGYCLGPGTPRSLLIGGCHLIFPCMPDGRVVTCPQCGTKFGTAKSFDTYRCPECFARFSKSGPHYSPLLILIVSALIVLAFVFLVVWTWP
jgi:hypothetical protein